MNEQLEDLLFLESMAEIQKHFKPFILRASENRIKEEKERESIRKIDHPKESRDFET